MLGYPLLATLILRSRDRWLNPGGSTLDILLLVLAATFAYSSFHALRAAMRQARAGSPAPGLAPRTWLPRKFFQHGNLPWGLLFGLLSLILAWPLMLRPELRPLCWLASAGAAAVLLNLVFVRARSEKGVFSELFATLTLSLSFPAFLVLAFGGWRSGFRELWLLSWLFNSSSVFYVKMCREAILPNASAENLIRSRKQLALFMMASIALLGSLWFRGQISGPPLLSLLPLWLMLRSGMKRPSLHPSVRHLGFSLLAQSILFGLILGAGF
jgi:hypothetical protein